MWTWVYSDLVFISTIFTEPTKSFYWEVSEDFWIVFVVVNLRVFVYIKLLAIHLFTFRSRFGFSPAWLVCLFKWYLEMNPLPHRPQWSGFSLAWLFMWLFRWFQEMNILPQRTQWYWFSPAWLSPSDSWSWSWSTVVQNMSRIILQYVSLCGSKRQMSHHQEHSYLNSPQHDCSCVFRWFLETNSLQTEHCDILRSQIMTTNTISPFSMILAHISSV